MMDALVASSLQEEFNSFLTVHDGDSANNKIGFDLDDIRRVEHAVQCGHDVDMAVSSQQVGIRRVAVCIPLRNMGPSANT